MNNTKVWILDIECLDGGGNPATLHFSSGEYVNESKDYYRGRIRQPGLFQAGLFTGDWFPSTRSSYGEIRLVNKDNGISFMSDYSFDGRSITLSLVKNGGVTEIFKGTMSRISFERDEVSIKLRDPAEVFENSHPFNTYLGNNVLPNGVEGVEDDIKGNVKPRVFGEVENAAPVLVNTAKLIYQISDTNCTVTKVTDNGADIKLGKSLNTLDQLLNTRPSPGTFDRFRGYFRLGAPLSGEVMCNATTSLPRLGDVFNKVLNDVGYSITNEHRAILNRHGNVRLMVSQETTTSRLLDQIITSIGGYWRIARDRSIAAGVIPNISSEPDYSFEDWQITQLSRSSSGSGQNGIPYYKTIINADRIENTQNNVVNSANKARLSKQYRKVESISQATRDKHPLSEVYELESYLASLNVAQDVSDRILSLVSIRRDNVSATVRVNENVNIKMLDTVRIISKYLGYEEGRNFLVIGYTLDAANNSIDLKLWG